MNTSVLLSQQNVTHNSRADKPPHMYVAHLAILQTVSDAQLKTRIEVDVIRSRNLWLISNSLSMIFI
jgi:hypothetical protein